MKPFALLHAVFVLALACPAAADGASELKRSGDAAMHAAHYEDALEAYDAAYAVEPDPAILYNRARALQGLGNYPEALASIESFEKLAPAALKQRVPKLA